MWVCVRMHICTCTYAHVRTCACKRNVLAYDLSLLPSHPILLLFTFSWPLHLAVPGSGGGCWLMRVPLAAIVHGLQL